MKGLLGLLGRSRAQASPCRWCSSQAGPWLGFRYSENDTSGSSSSNSSNDGPMAGARGIPPPAPPRGAYGMGQQQYPGTRGMGQPGAYEMPGRAQQSPPFAPARGGMPMAPPSPSGVPERRFEPSGVHWNTNAADEHGVYGRVPGYSQPPVPRVHPDRWQQQQQQQPPLSALHHAEQPQHLKPQNPGLSEASEAFGGLIESFYRKGLLQEVDHVFKGMKAAQILVGVPTYRTLLDIYSQLNDFDRMDTVYMEMRKAMMRSAGHQQPEPSAQQKLEASEYFVGLLDAWYKRGLLQEVQHVYKAMKAAQLTIAVPTYKILMETFSQLGDFEKMDAVYMEMREAMKRSAGSAFGQEMRGGMGGVQGQANPWGAGPGRNEPSAAAAAGNWRRPAVEEMPSRGPPLAFAGGNYERGGYQQPPARPPSMQMPAGGGAFPGYPSMPHARQAVPPMSMGGDGRHESMTQAAGHGMGQAAVAYGESLLAASRGQHQLQGGGMAVGAAQFQAPMHGSQFQTPAGVQFQTPSPYMHGGVPGGQFQTPPTMQGGLSTGQMQAPPSMHGGQFQFHQPPAAPVAQGVLSDGQGVAPTMQGGLPIGQMQAPPSSHEGQFQFHQPPAAPVAQGVSSDGGQPLGTGSSIEHETFMHVEQVEQVEQVDESEAGQSEEQQEDEEEEGAEEESFEHEGVGEMEGHDDVESLVTGEHGTQQQLMEGTG